MTPTEAFLRAANRFTLRHPLFGVIRFRCDVDTYTDGFRISASGLVPDRDTGKPLTIYTATKVSHAEVEALDTMSQVVDLLGSVIRNVLRDLFWHELDEMLCFDGKQVHDPHAVRRLVL